MSSEKYFACEAAQVAPGERVIVDIENKSIGVFNIDNEYFALLNKCPHRGAALCEGVVCGTNLETNDYSFNYTNPQGYIRCAWHGWEFNIKTGKSIIDDKVKARRFDVSVDDGMVFVHL